MSRSEVVLGDNEVVRALVDLYQKDEYRFEKLEDFKRVFTCLPGKCFYMVLDKKNDLANIKVFGLVLDFKVIKQKTSSFGKKKQALFNEFRTCCVVNKSSVEFLPKEIIARFNNHRMVSFDDFEAIGGDLARILKREVMLIYNNSQNNFDINGNFTFSLFCPGK